MSAEWNIVYDQVAIDIKIMATQLQEKKISVETAIEELLSFAKILKNTQEADEEEKASYYLQKGGEDYERHTINRNKKPIKKTLSKRNLSGTHS